MYNKVMVPASKLDAQYEQYNKTIYKICLANMPLLLPKYKEPKRCKRRIMGILFKAFVRIASEAVLAFIR